MVNHTYGMYIESDFVEILCSRIPCK